MNEITRIHIAKIPYDMEVSAKKELEQYLRILENSAEDTDWLQDIEIRITEILEERGVLRDGLITSEDVTAIKSQLGEPEDFMGEGDIAVGAPDSEPASITQRRLYRDPSTAMLGGVISGISQYIKINPIWIRLIFIVLLFASFGTAAVVYAVLWMVLPPATTAAAKLELSGEPVTLASLKTQRKKMAKGQETSRAAKIIQNILLYGTGTFAVIMAAITLVATLWVGAGLAFGTTGNSPFASMIPDGIALWTALSLFVLSGLLLSALLGLIATICFKRSFTKRIGIAMISIVIAGILSFGSAIGTVAYQSWQHAEKISASRHTKTVQLPATFAQVHTLTIGGDSSLDRNDGFTYSANVEYVVSAGAPRYELTLDSETAHIKPVVTITEDGTASIELQSKENKSDRFGFVQHPILRIYGPALKDITAKNATINYSASTQQEVLSVTAQSSQLSVAGAYKTLTAHVADMGSISLADASVDTLTATIDKGTIEAGVVRDLEITHPQSCPAYYDGQSQNTITLRAVTSGRMIHNGADVSAVSVKTDCGNVIIGDEDEYDTIEG